MPLYELLCLAQPALPREHVVRMIQRVASVLYTNGGVVTDLQSYGDQLLAYKIKGTRGKYEQANIWQLNFAVAPEVLKDINHELRVNEQVLRWVVVKRQQYPPLQDVRKLLLDKELQLHNLEFDSAAVPKASSGTEPAAA